MKAGPLAIYLPLLTGLGVLLVSVIAARVLRKVAAEQMEKRRLRADMAVFAQRALTAGVISLGIFLFFTVATQNVGAGFLGVLTAALVASLGLQDLFKNYVSGFYVLLERHVRVGDLVESGGYKGVVTEVRMRTTLLRDEDGSTIVVPNSELFNKTLRVSERKGAEDDASQRVEVSTGKV